MNRLSTVDPVPARNKLLKDLSAARRSKNRDLALLLQAQLEAIDVKGGRYTSLRDGFARHGGLNLMTYDIVRLQDGGSLFTRQPLSFQPQPELRVLEPVFDGKEAVWQLTRQNGLLVKSSIVCHFDLGQELFVREPWCVHPEFDPLLTRDIERRRVQHVWYKDAAARGRAKDLASMGRWRTPTDMPAWASRLRVAITSIKPVRHMRSPLVWEWNIELKRKTT